MKIFHLSDYFYVQWFPNRFFYLPNDKISSLSTKELQGSISPTFYEQLLRQIPFAKKLQTQIVST
jgi:hypothetical protein